MFNGRVLDHGGMRSGIGLGRFSRRVEDVSWFLLQSESHPPAGTELLVWR